MDDGISSDSVLGCAPGEAQHPLDVTREDVGLDVHAVADDAVAERGRGEGLGDERDLEPRPSGSSPTALTVSETPSTAIEPLSTTSGACSGSRRESDDPPGVART